MTKRDWLDKNFDKIKSLYPKIKVVYGPYNNSKDGRSRVVLYDGKSRSAKQFCRIKMEVKLNRLLGQDETVDHDDNNFLNDKYSNLVVRPRKAHINLDIKRRDHDFESGCKWCGISFKPNIKQVREIRKNKEKAGPFCSRSCTGKYGAYIRGGGSVLNRQKFATVYYTNKSRKD